MGYKSIRYVGLVVVFLVSGCSLFKDLPPPVTDAERRSALEGLTVDTQDVVSVYWSNEAIPYIVAKNDADAAYTLGLVHAHLRLGQMELLKRVAYGRVSEIIGIFGEDIDVALRTIDIGRAVPLIYQQMPDSSKQWLHRYVEGINAYKQQSQLPFEFEVLGLKDEPWSVTDTLTIMRLSGIDISWFGQLAFLRYYNTPVWEEVHAIWKQKGKWQSASAVPERLKALHSLLLHPTKAGSNSWAVGADKAQEGYAMLANDPHLGFTLPNTWVLVGIKSPSFQVVGASVAGIPAIAFGRNPYLAWGGTHMRASMSDFVQVSTSTIITRPSTFTNDLLGDHVVRLFSTEQGNPVLRGIDYLNNPDLALHWVGHHPSDEITALLGVMRSKNGFEMRQSLETYALPPQNFLYVEQQGNIGQLFGVQLPQRNISQWQLVRSAEDVASDWQQMVGALELPHIRNPQQGFLVSANNEPTTSTVVPIGFRFAHPQRYQRATELLQQQERVDRRYLQQMQLDTYSARDKRFNDYLAQKMQFYEVDSWLLSRMQSWDGYYAENSTGAVAYEAMRYGLFKVLKERNEGEIDREMLYKSLDVLTAVVREYLEESEAADSKRFVREAVAQAQAWLDPDWAWGDMHRIALKHPLAFIPILNEQYTLAEFGAGGSRDTLYKGAHNSGNEPHQASFGSQLRHISIMDDLDSNYFVLLGGQDGWLNNHQLTGMVELWRQNRLVQFPLREERVRKLFPTKILLKPKD